MVSAFFVGTQVVSTVTAQQEVERPANDDAAVIDDAVDCLPRQRLKVRDGHSLPRRINCRLTARLRQRMLGIRLTAAAIARLRSQRTV